MKYPFAIFGLGSLLAFSGIGNKTPFFALVGALASCWGVWEMHKEMERYESDD